MDILYNGYNIFVGREEDPSMKIAVIAEMAPAKTFIPIIKKLDADIVGLTHGYGAEELLDEFCTEMYPIGESRGQTKKRTNVKIAFLVLRDILNVIKSLSGKKIDLLMTCGNAGDVRKGTAASKILGIPTLHIEQDIYNPIEMIAFSNLITVPSGRCRGFLMEKYGLRNVKIIGGYPMASYVSEIQLKDADWIKRKYGVDDFILVVFGGDIRREDIPQIIKMVEKLQKDVLIAPFRFDAEYVRSMIKIANRRLANSQRIVARSPKLKVLDGFLDLLSLMNASSGLIYGAGMGITIEAGVLGVPSLKIAGFHKKHASVDLASELRIPVVEIGKIPDVIDDLKSPKGKWLIKGGKKAVSNVLYLINNFEDEKDRGSGFGSFRKIWNARSKFR